MDIILTKHLCILVLAPYLHQISAICDKFALNLNLFSIKTASGAIWTNLESNISSKA